MKLLQISQYIVFVAQFVTALQAPVLLFYGIASLKKYLRSY